MKVFVNQKTKIFLLMLTLITISFSKEGKIGNNIYLPVLVISPRVTTSGYCETASGFYFDYKSKVYFITARHVLFDSSLNLKYKELTLASYTPSTTGENQDIIKIDLSYILNTRFLLYNRSIDIVAIEFAQDDTTNSDVIFIHGKFVTWNKKSNYGILKSHSYTLYDSISIPEDCFILGYPTSIGIEESPQIDKTRPLLREGIVAGKNDHKRTIILDCPAYYGNSGGPVIEVYVDNNFTTQMRLIGVVIEFVPYEEKWVNLNSRLINSQWYNSGYSVVEPIDKIIELIDKQK